jgi:hypothetical protein
MCSTRGRTSALVLFPALYREEAIGLRYQRALGPPMRACLVADTIAARTAQPAPGLYQRICGLSQGSILDPIVA